MRAGEDCIASQRRWYVPSRAAVPSELATTAAPRPPLRAYCWCWRRQMRLAAAVAGLPTPARRCIEVEAARDASGPAAAETAEAVRAARRDDRLRYPDTVAAALADATDAAAEDITPAVFLSVSKIGSQSRTLRMCRGGHTADGLGERRACLLGGIPLSGHFDSAQCDNGGSRYTVSCIVLKERGSSWERPGWERFCEGSIFLFIFLSF